MQNVEKISLKKFNFSISEKSEKSERLKSEIPKLVHCNLSFLTWTDPPPPPPPPPIRKRFKANPTSFTENE